MGLLVSGQNPAAIKTAERNIFTATASQTSFTITQGYQPGDIDVYLNGIRLVDTEDYIALNGSTVVLNEAATVGDSVVVVCFYPFSVTSHYTKSESDTRYVNAGGDTMTGALALPSGGLTVGTDQLIVDSLGRVRTPYQPAFSVVKTTTLNAGTGTYTNWDIVHINVGNHFNTTTGVFTAPVNGNYLFSHSYLNSGTGYNNIFLYKNNVVFVGSGARPTTTVYDQATKTIIIPLVTNDTIRISDALGGTSGSHSDSNGWTQFSGFLIG